jgi:hypothetical protein
MVQIAVSLWLFCLVKPAIQATPTPKEALQGFQSLIGSWKGTGVPQGTRDDRDKGFWIEMIAWQWKFKDKDVWLRADIEKGKHYSSFELRYLADKDAFELKATTLAKETQTFVGKLSGKRLTLDHHDARAKQTHRLVFSLLHFNRHLYRAEVKADGIKTFTQVYQVGATKQGVAFASVDKGPECIVSGGLGTMPVTHKGKTYYVCCTGCRDAFKDDPEKYIKEYEEEQKKKKKEKE